MKITKLLLSAILLVGACLVFSPGTSGAESKWDTSKEVTVTEGDIVFTAYLSKDGKESWIYKIKVNAAQTELKLPDKINEVPVTRIGFGEEQYEEDADCYYSIFQDILEPWHGCYGDDNKLIADIKTLYLPAGVTEIEAGSFSGLKSLETLKIPDGVTELKNYVFSACASLKKVTLPKNLSELSENAFKKTRNISAISISKKSPKYYVKNKMLIKKKGKCLVWTAPKQKKLDIPGGIKKLEAYALAGTKASSVIIPKSVKSIGLSALTGKNISKIQLKKGNKAFKMDGGSLYQKSNGKLVAVLVKKSKVKISSKVKILGVETSVMGGYIERVDIPKSVKKVIEDWMFFPSGAKVYFHGKKPPVIQSKYPGYIYTAIPIFNHVYVPKGSKKTYEKWAADRDGLEWEYLHTF